MRGLCASVFLLGCSLCSHYSRSTLKMYPPAGLVPMHKIATYQSEGSSVGDMRSQSVAGECGAVRLEGEAEVQREVIVCAMCNVQ